ncbi:PQQ-binding-like beta-propeller repeat protein [Phenylobacterium sp.]|uniref:outer membrane protein assembly factor BamB family protein n=1 Tax=Phenylobacterium sp. TaxID=1871053 RepID=UPI002B8EC13A|nr:PQQ-binding-like beta-propeller repeat protein [Phenylobacterium sp.]HLZ73633.1 PQQ-binding-like beta-propeller repeat protein [Phenylobacterium sp.]
MILRRAASRLLAAVLLAASAGGSAAAQEGAPTPNAAGAAVFEARCKSCHEPPVARAPSRDQLRSRSNQEILEALTGGIMKPMATGLSAADLTAVATFLTGRSVQAQAAQFPAQPAPVSVAPSAAAQIQLGKVRAVSPAMLHDPSPGDWLQWGRTYDGQNFSPLTAINRETVKSLSPAWRAPLPSGPSMPTPIVHDGVMFLQTSPDMVVALDAANGTVLWRRTYKPTVPSNQKMGLSLSGGRVFVPTSDLHVISLDARTGEQVWDHEIAIEAPARDRKAFVLRSAPLIVGDKVIQGVTASGAPGGGFIIGMDIATGRELWRFHTIARPGEPGGDSWNGLSLDKRSGASVWDQGTYDKALNLVYFGVGQTYDTGPLLKPSGVPGTTQDALYTDSTLALDPDTGKLVWHFQHLPNDQWDLDWVFERTLATLNIDGRPRRVVMTLGKMAILDALDAKTGAYLFSIDPGTQNVISAIDRKTGAKTIDPQRVPDLARPTVICPGPSGARSWPATSTNPHSGLLFAPLTQWCMLFGPPSGYQLLSSGVGLTPADHPEAAKSGMMGRLQAMDLKGRKLAWKHDLTAPISTSALATAGGVVFAGDLDPALKAFDDRDGKLLWQAPLDNYPSSSVITYSVGQTQYVAVVTGLRNNHIGDLSRRYQAFRRARGGVADTPKGEPAVVVFALGGPRS